MRRFAVFVDAFLKTGQSAGLVNIGVLAKTHPQRLGLTQLELPTEQKVKQRENYREAQREDCGEPQAEPNGDRAPETIKVYR